MSNNQFSRSITTREIKDVLNFALRHKRSVYIVSAPGVGKSDVVREFSEEYSGKPHKESCIDIRLAMEVPENLRGIAIPTNKEDGSIETIYAIPTYWPTDPNWKGVIFFDELSSAPPSMQVVAYQALLDRRIGDQPFPEGAVVCGAGNREGEGLVYKLLPAVSNRVVQVEIRPDVDVWMEDYAYDKGIDGAVISFLEQQPNNFHTGDQDSDCPAFASPRSWGYVDEVIRDMRQGLINESLGFTLVEGSVGTGVSAAFRSHYKYGCRLPKPEDVLKGKNPELEADDPSAFYTLGYNCMTMWINHFKNVEISDEKLLTEVTNMFDYFQKNVKMKGETELHLAFLMKIHEYAVKNIDKYKRKIHLMMTNDSSSVGESLTTYAELMQSAKQ